MAKNCYTFRSCCCSVNQKKEKRNEKGITLLITPGKINRTNRGIERTKMITPCSEESKSSSTLCKSRKLYHSDAAVMIILLP